VSHFCLWSALNPACIMKSDKNYCCECTGGNTYEVGLKWCILQKFIISLFTKSKLFRSVMSVVVPLTKFLANIICLDGLFTQAIFWPIGALIGATAEMEAGRVNGRQLLVKSGQSRLTDAN